MRVLLVRTSALGDVVHALPVLSALRRHQPAARIGWVVEEAMAPLLDGHPDLDCLLVVRLRAWRRAPLAPRTLREIAAFVAALDRFAPEVVLDLMGNHKAGILGALSLADRRIGLERRARRERSSALWISESAPRRGRHAVEEMLAMLAPLGVPAAPADFGGDRLLATAPPASAALLEGAPEFALVHPGAGWGNKRYPAAWWGEVARELRDDPGLEVWAAAAPGEELLAREVAVASDGAARAVPAPSLAALAALCRRSRLVLGGDSGPLHLAHALGAPVLALLGPTDPERHGPYGAPERALWVRLPCSFCHRRFEETKACLLAIPPQRVAARARALLGAGRPAPLC